MGRREISKFLERFGLNAVALKTISRRIRKGVENDMQLVILGPIFSFVKNAFLRKINFPLIKSSARLNKECCCKSCILLWL